MVALSSIDANKYNRIIHHKVQYKDTIKTDNAQEDNGESSVRTYPQYDNQENIVHHRNNTQTWLTPNEIDQIVILYNGGVTVRDIAKQFNCNRKTISRKLKQRGVSVMQSKLMKQANAKEIINLYQSGLTTAQIADKYGVSVSSVMRLLSAHNVQMRTRWDY
jgi:DNA-binding CsgD family transcriptional regulator